MDDSSVSLFQWLIGLAIAGFLASLFSDKYTLWRNERVEMEKQRRNRKGRA